MRAYIPLAAVLLCAALPACSHAQSNASPPPPGARTLSGTVPSRQPAPTAYFGFGWALRDEERPTVSQVAPNSPAAEAGLKVGDTIVAVDGRDTLEPFPMFRGAVPGRRYTLRIARGTETHDVVIVAAPIPPKT